MTPLVTPRAMGTAVDAAASRRPLRRRPVRRGPPPGPGRWTPRVRLRDLTPSDGAALQAVFDGLSGSSRYLRFHGHVPRLAAEARRALLDVDGRSHVALVAEARQGRSWTPIGIGRLIRIGPGVGEVALEVVDAWQRRGVGRRLLAALRERAVALGYDEVHGEVLLQNTAIIALLGRALPRARLEPDGYGAATVVWPVRDAAPTALDTALSAFDPLRSAAHPS